MLATACGLGIMILSLPAQAAGTQAWRDFARRSLTPDYGWNDAPAAQQLAPTLRGTAFGTSRGSDRVVYLLQGKSSLHRNLSLGFDHMQGSGAAAGAMTSLQAPGLSTRLSPLHRTLLDATYEQDVGARGRIGISALMAQQQYATPGFGVLPGFRSADTFDARAIPGDNSTGHGVRLDYLLPAGERLSWHAMVQSRLEMNTLESVHGIYAEPGDFDLPARLGAKVEWQANNYLALAIGLERVYYSDITPFTSPTLPARLLSLMADGSAPVFAWQDLTVYSAEGRLADRWQGEWSLRYSTRQQPSPTAALYRQALEPEYTNTNVALGYQRGLSHWGQILLNVSYAPSMAFLGPGPAFASRTYARGAIAEFEAAWILPF